MPNAIDKFALIFKLTIVIIFSAGSLGCGRILGLILIARQSGKLAFVFEFAVLVKDPPLTSGVTIGKITDVFEPAVLFVEFTRTGGQTIAKVTFVFEPAVLVIFFAAANLEGIDKYPFRSQLMIDKALADQVTALIITDDVAVLAGDFDFWLLALTLIFLPG